jgi:hypothetical protein
LSFGNRAPSVPVLQRNKEEELAYWRKIIARFSTSDINKYEFCGNSIMLKLRLSMLLARDILLVHQSAGV